MEGREPSNLEGAALFAQWGLAGLVPDDGSKDSWQIVSLQAERPAWCGRRNPEQESIRRLGKILICRLLNDGIEERRSADKIGALEVNHESCAIREGFIGQATGRRYDRIADGRGSAVFG